MSTQFRQVLCAPYTHLTAGTPMDDKYALIALVVILAILAVYWAYTQCKLNKYLSPKLQKNCGSFVGSMAQHPQLVPCAFPVSDDWQMNRCNYM